MCKKNLFQTPEMEEYFNHKRFFPFISLVLLFFICWILKILSYYIIPLIFGFLGAAIRSYYKECRCLKRAKELEKKAEKEVEKADELRKKAKQSREKIEPKHWKDMLWTYMVNYTIILSSIYIVVGYHLNFVNRNILFGAILFGLGFFVDNVFLRPLGLLRP
jgi:hypothetical protein